MTLDAEDKAFLRDMRDRKEILDCVTRYCRGIDRRDIGLAKSAYHPQAADDHQRKNAEALAQAGAAEMILQRDLNGPALAARIRYYFEHREELRRMEHNSQALGRPDATERIVDLVEELSGLRQPRLEV